MKIALSRLNYTVIKPSCWMLIIRRRWPVSSTTYLISCQRTAWGLGYHCDHEDC